MPNPLPAPHLLTCPPRADSLALTLASWRETSWPGLPTIHTDPTPESPAAPWGSAARQHRIDSAFLHLLRQALATPGSRDSWLLLLEDDIVFHPRLPILLSQWQGLAHPTCQLATLFNPCLQEIPHLRETLPGNTFAADPATFLGGQALLLRRHAARTVLEKWDTETGIKSTRLAKLLPGPILVRTPSLVQHTATDSAWAAPINRAIDFHPHLEQAPEGPAI